MKFFLTAKHWQIFLLIIAPIVAQLIGMTTTDFGRDLASPAWPILIGWIGTALLFVWFYSVGSTAAKVAPADVPMKRSWFRFSAVYPPAYFLVFFAFFFYAETLIATSSMEPENMLLFLGMFVLILPLHILAMVCMVYTLYYNARALKAAELQRRPEFGDYIGDIFLFWFFIIGIWAIQPRVNRVLGNAGGVAS